MSEPSSTKAEQEASDQDVFEHLAHSAHVAKQNQFKFWLLSLSWGGVLCVLVAVYIYQINSLQSLVDNSLSEIKSQSSQLESQSELMAALRTQMEGNRTQIVDLYDSLLFLASINFDNLDTEARNNLGNKIAEQANNRTGSQSGGGITATEKQFLGKFSTTDIEDVATAEEAYRKGTAAISQGEHDRGIAFFKAAIDNFAEPYVPAYQAMGRAYTEIRNYDAAIASFEQSLTRKADASVMVWTCYAYNGRFATAAQQTEGMRYQMLEGLELCNQAIAQDATNWWAYNTRGFTNLLLGNNMAAVNDWERAAEIYFDPSYTEENIGIAYLAMGNWQRAYDWSMRFSTSYPSADSTWNAFVRAVAADKLQNADAGPAMRRWEELKASRNVDSLKKYTRQFLAYF